MSKTIGSPGLMDPQEQWGRNRACRAYGRRGEGYAAIHSRAKRRYRCKRCRRTFAETPLHRLRTARDEGVTTVTLLAYGCPVQAMLATFGLDEWTVARWQARAGQQCRRVHEHLVQVDEIGVRAVGGALWLASAMSVVSRLWLGGVVGQARDARLIRSLLERVRARGPKQARR